MKKVVPFVWLTSCIIAKPYEHLVLRIQAIAILDARHVVRLGPHDRQARCAYGWRATAFDLAQSQDHQHAATLLVIVTRQIAMPP
jgi:hypothetical protein